MHCRHAAKGGACLKALKHWHHFTPGKPLRSELRHLGSLECGFTACAWLQGGLGRRMQQIWDVRKRKTSLHRDCKAHNSDAVTLALCWFPEFSGLVSTKPCLTRNGCKLMTLFHLWRFSTSFFPKEAKRALYSNCSWDYEQSNFFTKFKLLPLLNIHLFAFHLHRLSKLIEFISVPGTGTCPPTPIPRCHPVRRTAPPGHGRIASGPVSRQIRHANIWLYTIWRLKLQMHWENHSRNLILYMD